MRGGVWGIGLGCQGFRLNAPDVGRKPYDRCSLYDLLVHYAHETGKHVMGQDVEQMQKMDVVEPET